MSKRITCPVWGKTSIMILKKTSTRTAGKIYVHKKWNVYHHTNRKWCYLNKDHLKVPEIRKAIEATQALAQNNTVVAQTPNNGFSLEPGMGIEPMYSGSAAHRLNRSATPAVNRLKATNFNKTFL